MASIRPGRNGHTRSRYTGTRILEVIRSRGHSQVWVAEQMGVHPQHFNRVALGRLPISNEFVAAACRVLQLPPSALFYVKPLLDVSHEGMPSVTEESYVAAS